MKKWLFGLALCIAASAGMAIENPEVPPMCYRIMDAEITCTEVARDHARIYQPDKLAIVQHSLDKMRSYRAKLANPNYKITQAEQAVLQQQCMGEERTKTLDWGPKVIALLHQPAEKDGGVKCSMALQEIQ